MIKRNAEVALLAALAVSSIIVGTLLGSVGLSPAEVFKSEVAKTIFFRLRFPRTLMAFITGASLALVGSTFQSLLKNPLVDPYLIGISAGAAFGATLSLSMAEKHGYFWILMTPILAFGFSVLSSSLAVVFSKRGKRISTGELILAGVAMNMIFSSGTVFLLYFMRRSSQGYGVWLFGSLSGVLMKDLILPAVLLVLYLMFSLVNSRKLDAFSLGEDFAKVVGVESERLKLSFFLFGVFLTSVLVSKVGSIGFVGLIIPHLVRMIFGPAHTSSIILVALLGGSFLSYVDTFSRIIAPPLEVPIGIVTSFVGIPIFLYVMKRGGRK